MVPITCTAYLALLQGIKRGWQTRIPKRIVHSNSPDNRIKARKAWLQIVFIAVNDGMHQGHLPKEFIQEREAAYEQMQRIPLRQRLTDERDIGIADTLLSKAMKHVQERLARESSSAERRAT